MKKCDCGYYNHGALCVPGPSRHRPEGCPHSPTKEDAEAPKGRHKWADVLHAVAEGKTVQFQRIGCLEYGIETWYDADHNALGYLAKADPHLNWRIKPTPKPDTIRFRCSYKEGYTTPGVPSVLYRSLEQCRNRGKLLPTPGGIVKETFDGETGQLKSVEIVK